MGSIFKGLVVVSALLSVLFWCIPLVDFMWLDYEQLRILDMGGFGAIISTGDLVYWGTLFGWLILSIGIYLYVKIARLAFVLFLVINIVLGLCYGIAVYSPLEAFVGSIIAMIDGAIITMMYLTSVSSKFNENT